MWSPEREANALPMRLIFYRRLKFEFQVSRTRQTITGLRIIIISQFY